MKTEKNYETLNTILYIRYNDKANAYFTQKAQEAQGDKQALAEAVKNYLHDLHGEAQVDNILISDFISAAISRVDAAGIAEEMLEGGTQ